MGAKKLSSVASPNGQLSGYKIWNLTDDGFVSIQNVEDLDCTCETSIKKINK